jgi:two-component system CheB/CheR fusion protein
VTSHVYIPPAGHRWEPHRGGETVQIAAPPREMPGSESLREAERILLSRYTPPAVVVNENLDIVQFRGDTGPYLTPAPGRATHNLLKMLREGLMVGVRSALNRTRKENVAVRTDDLRVRANGGWRSVDVQAIPIKGRGSDTSLTYLIVFEEPATAIVARAQQLHEEALAELERSASRSGRGESAKEATRLTQELAASREYLQSVIEQQEAANEEVQSANEELQSINEELETSKEEIQSTNEELATVNDELSNRNAELSQSNNDLSNLFASVQSRS